MWRATSHLARIGGCHGGTRYRFNHRSGRVQALILLPEDCLTRSERIVVQWPASLCLAFLVKKTMKLWVKLLESERPGGYMPNLYSAEPLKLLHNRYVAGWFAAVS
jgi:hypothetical protein